MDIHHSNSHEKAADQAAVRAHLPVVAEWAEQVAGDLVARTYSEPRWSKKRGAVVAELGPGEIGVMDSVLFVVIERATLSVMTA